MSVWLALPSTLPASDADAYRSSSKLDLESEDDRLDEELLAAWYAADEEAGVAAWEPVDGAGLGTRRVD
jgi:hypothetical protein